MTQLRSKAENPGAEAPADARPPRGGWRALVHWFGMACLMVAAGFAGYIAWSLWGTGLHTAEAQDRLRTEFRQELQGEPADPSTATELVPLGDAYAQLLIPAIDVNFMVVQGTGYEDLKDGPDHYPDTADPWDDTGRVGIAGHRTTYQAPFFDLEQLRAGDEITLRTQYGTFVYEVDRVFVVPSAGSGRVLVQTPKPTLVLTTCNPKYSSAERLIVTARRVSAS
ncbi:MAG: sortase [Actinomycetota bacterium]